jgi:hypothetical protein
MSDSNYNWTPASQAALGIDPDGPPMEESWSYRSIVGMLLYLSTNTRPNIAFAVSQVARFCHSPKKSHASAVKTLVRYLHRSSEMGMIVKPTGTLSRSRPFSKLREVPNWVRHHPRRVPHFVEVSPPE